MPAWAAVCVLTALLCVPLAGVGAGWMLRASWLGTPEQGLGPFGQLAVRAFPVGHRVATVEPRRVPTENETDTLPADPFEAAKERLERARDDARERAEKLDLGERPTASKLLIGQVSERWKRKAGAVQKTPGTLQWPVPDGWFTRGYGSGMDGYHQAVDIMGPRGSAVHAAARGIVGYAGDGVRGYGNIVLLIHPGGWVTMYAHNTRNLVTSGQKVQRGQLIAELGNTGISRGPHVHFEFMFSGRQCDPSRLFRPGIRHRGGELSEIGLETWSTPRDKPEELECNRRRRHPESRYVQHGRPSSEGAEGG